MAYILNDGTLRLSKKEKQNGGKFYAIFSEAIIKDDCIYGQLTSTDAACLTDEKTGKAFTYPGLCTIPLDTSKTVDKFIIDTLSQYQNGFTGRVNYDDGEMSLKVLENPAYKDLALGTFFTELSELEKLTIDVSGFKAPHSGGGKQYKSPLERANERIDVLVSLTEGANLARLKTIAGDLEADLITVVSLLF
jgi:hypothetical protein